MDKTERLTLREVADLTGLPLDSIRKRVYRGTLPAQKIDGQYKVLAIDAVKLAPLGETPSTPEGETQGKTGIGQGETPLVDGMAREYIDSLLGTIDHLRGENAYLVRKMAEERERADVLQREALNRIEALTAGVLMPNEPDTDEHVTEPVEASPNRPGTTEPDAMSVDTLHQRSRLSDIARRLFGRSR